MEPLPSVWRLPDPADDRETVGDLVGVGGDLLPGTLLAAYRRGLFPMPLPAELRHDDPDSAPIGWWSPDPRGILPLDGLRVSRSLRKSMATFEIRVDTAFADVIRACADPTRPDGWIDHDIIEAYSELFALGWAHCVEAWDRSTGELVGGLYGVAIGGLFAGESMFHRKTDASKAALVGLVSLLNACDFRLLDVQWTTEHLRSLGAVDVERAHYLRVLHSAVEVVAQPFGAIDETRRLDSFA